MFKIWEMFQPSYSNLDIFLLYSSFSLIIHVNANLELTSNIFPSQVEGKKQILKDKMHHLFILAEKPQQKLKKRLDKWCPTYLHPHCCWELFTKRKTFPSISQMNKWCVNMKQSMSYHYFSLQGMACLQSRLWRER